MTEQDGSKHRAKRTAFLPLVWIGSAIAATVLVLGVNGTLSSWSSAIITNTNDTAVVSNAVVLQETGPGATPAVCNSTDSDTGVNGTNSATCATINKYGGTATPLAPGASQTVTVTMKNTGTESGTLTLQANGCTASGGSTGAPSLCNGPLTVKVDCPTGTNILPASTPTAFTAAGAKQVGTLTAGSTVACTFTVALSATASAQYSGQQISQPLVWTLSGA